MPRSNNGAVRPRQGSGCRKFLRESRQIDREAFRFYGRYVPFRNEGFGRQRLYSYRGRQPTRACEVRHCVRRCRGTTKFAGFVPGGFGFETAQGFYQLVQFAVVDGSSGVQDGGNNRPLQTRVHRAAATGFRDRLQARDKSRQ